MKSMPFKNLEESKNRGYEIHTKTHTDAFSDRNSKIAVSFEQSTVTRRWEFVAMGTVKSVPAARL